MDGDIEELRKRVADAAAEVDRIWKNILDPAMQNEHEARLVLANALCPFKVGDVIVNWKGERAKLAEVGLRYGSYNMQGYYLKKDGTPGTRKRELYQFSNTDWKLYEE